MRKALIVGVGIAGPVAAMALQRAGIEAVVCEAYPQTAEEVGSYLTVASNGLDALRAIGTDGPVLDAGFPTPTNLLLSSGDRRLGRVSNAGRLADGTAAHTIKRARLYRALHQHASDAPWPARPQLCISWPVPAGHPPGARLNQKGR